MVNRIHVAGLQLDHFWHCFGTERHRAELPLVLQMLKTSRTNVLPVNTHRLDATRDPDALEHGFAGATYAEIGRHVDLDGYVTMLNINLRTSTAAAVEAAKTAFDMTGERVLKLEVLDDRLRRSNDADVIAAARELMAWEPSLVVLPLLANDPESAKKAYDAGCPLLRVMGSAISSGTGIGDRAAFEEICALPVPVVLDGGIGEAAHIHTAAQSGAVGALVNSVLFDSGRDTIEVMKELRAAADAAFAA
ncbi:hypothetical protein ACGRHY_18145 [Streptomyces sp. HK10]|uniref:hypothetical protein n=1 Tax=Streptomyces sp. HK10 TaxID=3373255 RepID=UPI003748F561